MVNKKTILNNLFKNQKQFNESNIAGIDEFLPLIEIYNDDFFWDFITFDVMNQPLEKRYGYEFVVQTRKIDYWNPNSTNNIKESICNNILNDIKTHSLKEEIEISEVKDKIQNYFKSKKGKFWALIPDDFFNIPQNLFKLDKINNINYWVDKSLKKEIYLGTNEGYYYLPYIPFTLTPKVINLTTCTEGYAILSRYAKKITDTCLKLCF
jgi:hypothetical protein